VTDPYILLHPNIPKPLHGIAPRVIMGKEWWDTHRRQAYADAGYQCEACGVPKQEAKYHQWLEAHEVYDYDYKRGRITFKKLVALCHSCHNFIHSGRLEMLRQSGEISQDKYEDIIDHGMMILAWNDIVDEWETRHDHPAYCEWHEWHMMFEGKRFGPSTFCYEEWEAGEWKNWRP